ncbi:hypothetical protein PIB30_103500, partial [Stylosanthes scabra]|nr:hypothetical protein [Stylosanthes scabra]
MKWSIDPTRIKGPSNRKLGLVYKPELSNQINMKCKGVFEGLESLVDVGGNTGTMAKAIAETFPQMECTVFEETKDRSDGNAA